MNQKRESKKYLENHFSLRLRLFPFMKYFPVSMAPIHTKRTKKNVKINKFRLAATIRVKDLRASLLISSHEQKILPSCRLEFTDSEETSGKHACLRRKDAMLCQNWLLHCSVHTFKFSKRSTPSITPRIQPGLLHILSCFNSYQQLAFRSETYS